jgi:hypothetical protein
MGIAQQIFCTHGPQYLERFERTMPANHRKVVQAIALCRSSDNGATVYQCAACGEYHLTHRSCGNRHCPGCQQHKSYAWLARQLERQLPTHYFMLTFTVPEPLRAFLRSHQHIGYGALFESSSGAIKVLAQNHLGADTPGFFGVLHTWGRQLSYHPHIHYVVPGGALSSADSRWHGSSSGFYLPVHALSRIFRAKFRDAMAAAGVLGDIPAEVWTTDWNVNCQAVGEAAGTLRYLARYVFQVAISERRILRVDDTHVHFQYRKPHSNRVRTLALPVMEFMRRFLQHVLPRGFVKVRHYGFLSPSFGVPVDEIRARIELAQGFAQQATTSEIQIEPLAPMRCTHCGGELQYRRVILPRSRVAISIGSTSADRGAQAAPRSLGAGP